MIGMRAPGLLNAAATARLIGLPPDAFYARRAEMQAQGFPAPLLEFRGGSGHAVRRYWSRSAVQRWLDGWLAIDAGRNGGEDQLDELPVLMRTAAL